MGVVGRFVWNKSALIGWKVSELLESVSQQSSTPQSVRVEPTGLHVSLGEGGGRRSVVGEALHGGRCGPRKTPHPELLLMDTSGHQWMAE